MTRGLTIGRLAKLAQVGVETIRYYQRRGLLPEPDKPLNGFRHYRPEMVHRVRFIKRAQALGFTLDETVGLLRLEGARVCTETRTAAARKLEVIDEKLDALSAMRRALAELLRQCDAETTSGCCPIIEALSRDEST